MCFLQVPPLCATADQEEKTRKEGEDPVSKGRVEERQVSEHASQQGGGRFIRRGHDFLVQLVTLPELWSQPSFPEFVNWLIRLGTSQWEVTYPPIIIFLTQGQRGKTSNSCILVR